MVPLPERETCATRRKFSRGFWQNWAEFPRQVTTLYEVKTGTVWVSVLSVPACVKNH